MDGKKGRRIHCGIIRNIRFVSEFNLSEYDADLLAKRSASYSLRLNSETNLIFLIIPQWILLPFFPSTS